MSARVAEGWTLRGIPALVLENAEPWTGRPMQLEEARAAGRARVLQPGESLEIDVAFALYSGLDAVSAGQHQGDGVAVL